MKTELLIPRPQRPVLLPIAYSKITQSTPPSYFLNIHSNIIPIYA